MAKTASELASADFASADERRQKEQYQENCQRLLCQTKNLLSDSVLPPGDLLNDSFLSWKLLTDRRVLFGDEAAASGSDD